MRTETWYFSMSWKNRIGSYFGTINIGTPIQKPKKSTLMIPLRVPVSGTVEDGRRRTD